MKTIYLIRRNSYKMEPISAYESRNDAEQMAQAFNDAFIDQVEIVEIPYNPIFNQYVNPVTLEKLQANTKFIADEILELKLNAMKGCE